VCLKEDFLLNGAQRLALAVAGSALALAAGVPAMATSTTPVTIAHSSFSPNPVDVPVGTEIRWTNEDGFEHTVTSDDGRSFDSGPLSKDQVFRQTFDQPRSYTYHCKVHPSMQATVVVRGESTTTTESPATTSTESPTTTTTVTEPAAEKPVPTTSAPPGPVPAPVSKTPKTTRAPVTTTVPVHTEVAQGPATLAVSPTPPAPGAAPDATQPPSAVALGVARGRAEKGTSFGGLAAAGIALALGGGWWALRRRRRSGRR
jgi:plastocyanin